MATDQHDRLPSDLTLADRDYVALCLQAARNEFERSGDPQYVYMIAAYIGKLSTIDEQLRPKGIAERNDDFRRTGVPYLTQGAFMLPDLDLVIRAVREYDDFDQGNDPYKEHDFGAFDWGAERVYWKIDYTDPETGYWRDPMDDECQRVMTVMLSSEY